MKFEGGFQVSMLLNDNDYLARNLFDCVEAEWLGV